MTPYGAEALQVTVSTIGSDQSNSVGTAGGYPGAGANAFLVRATDVWERIRDGSLPLGLDHLRGVLEALPAKQAFRLGAGDVFATQPHGGGGLGDPLERDPKAVLRDVIQGFVSREWAAQAFGVVLTDEDAVDMEGTRRAREARRRERLVRGGGRAGEVRGRAAGPPRGRRFGETLRVRDGTVVCASCEFPLCDEGTNPKERCLVVEEDLGAANPRIAVRWKGRSEKFRLVAYVCPGCGVLLDLHERRREESGHWYDCRLG
jgi:N-methylhydantoinase B